MLCHAYFRCVSAALVVKIAVVVLPKSTVVAVFYRAHAQPRCLMFVARSGVTLPLPSPLSTRSVVVISVSASGRFAVTVVTPLRNALLRTLSRNALSSFNSCRLRARRFFCRSAFVESARSVRYCHCSQSWGAKLPSSRWSKSFFVTSSAIAAAARASETRSLIATMARLGKTPPCSFATQLRLNQLRCALSFSRMSLALSTQEFCARHHRPGFTSSPELACRFLGWFRARPAYSGLPRECELSGAAPWCHSHGPWLP